ncbi:MAG: GGDEF domain-containing phosphodiesterase [Saccharofermentans sp.]|nr:GGDEF domain-containing phosphodiesterase [Saccharofermentans sp.]
MLEFYNLSFAFSVSAFIICLSNLFFIRVQGRMGKLQNKLFMLLLIIVALNSICTSVTAYYNPVKDYSDSAMSISEISRYIYFLIHTGLAPLFYFYVSYVCGMVFNKFDARKVFNYFVFGITEALALTNPITHWVYYANENREFVRSWGEVIIYLAAAYYFTMALAHLTTTWRVLNQKRRVGILTFASITILGILIQLFIKDLKVELLAEAIGLTGVMMVVENEDDRLDQLTGLYNRQAFITDCQGYLINKVSFHAMCIRVMTPEIISRNSGADIREIIEKQVSQYLESLQKRYNIYRIGRRTFVITWFDRTSEEVYRIAENIISRFERPWKASDTMVLLSSSIVIAKIPEQIDRVNDAMYMFDNSNSAKTDKKILAGEDINTILRNSAVEKAISRGLAEGKFEVYYQATVRGDAKTIHGAEALVRLHDDEMGMLFPDEFIPVAEHNGLIDAIDDYVLMEVCKLIKEENLASRSIDCINVNLSVLQLMKSGFVEHINGIVEHVGIDKSMINFEVTESVSAESYELLSNRINDLKHEGFLFSMDDYGTGYSNMKALASMNLDCIKIDKSILWEAQKSELGQIILENSIRMIRQIKNEILVEGVETLSQVELLKKLDVDYMQGFYFSKPVPKETFLEIVNKYQKG